MMLSIFETVIKLKSFFIFFFSFLNGIIFLFIFRLIKTAMFLASSRFQICDIFFILLWIYSLGISKSLWIVCQLLVKQLTTWNRYFPFWQNTISKYTHIRTYEINVKWLFTYKKKIMTITTTTIAERMKLLPIWYFYLFLLQWFIKQRAILRRIYKQTMQSMKWHQFSNSI